MSKIGHSETSGLTGTRDKNLRLFRWFMLILASGYLFVFYQLVSAYKEGLTNDRFTYDKPFIFDTKTGALYIFGDVEIEARQPSIASLPIDGKAIPLSSAEEDLGFIPIRKYTSEQPNLKINTHKVRVLYEAVNKDIPLGTYDEFLGDLLHPEKRRMWYKRISAEFEVGTYDEFEAKLGF